MNNLPPLATPVFASESTTVSTTTESDESTDEGIAVAALIMWLVLACAVLALNITGTVYTTRVKRSKGLAIAFCVIGWLFFPLAQIGPIVIAHQEAAEDAADDGTLKPRDARRAARGATNP